MPRIVHALVLCTTRPFLSLAIFLAQPVVFQAHPGYIARAIWALFPHAIAGFAFHDFNLFMHALRRVRQATNLFLPLVASRNATNRMTMRIILWTFL